MEQLSEEDIKFEALFKEEGYKAGDNPWFTPRVLNRLPEREHSVRWVWWAICAVAAVICAACWWWLVDTHDYTVLTVRDMVDYAIMSGVTLVLLWQSISVTLSRE